MENPSLVIALTVVAVGAIAVAVAGHMGRRRPAPVPMPAPELLVEQIARATANQHQEAMAQMLATNRELLEAERLRSGAELDGTRSVLDAQLSAMTNELGKVTGLVQEFERDRSAKLNLLSGALNQQGEGIAALAATTQSLREALSSTKARGQWGERMAEDVLRLAGFVENVQYRKQVSVAGGSGIPDFTFLLPQGSVLYMDVKFPLDNYMRYLESDSELEQQRFRTDFLKDVRAKIKELAAREYAKSDADTIDCVLLFIPNEQLYGFVQEHDAGILDDALRHQIVMCSPLTLFAVLAVVRQAVDSFRLERKAGEILEALGGFDKQWLHFVKKMDTLGTRLESASKAYEELSGVRRRGLERQLDRIAALRDEQTLALVEDDGDEDPHDALDLPSVGTMARLALEA